jgi:hypothetical protein
MQYVLDYKSSRINQMLYYNIIYCRLLCWILCMDFMYGFYVWILCMDFMYGFYVWILWYYVITCNWPKIYNKQDLNRFLLRVTEYPTFHITCHRVPYLSHYMSQGTLPFTLHVTVYPTLWLNRPHAWGPLWQTQHFEISIFLQNISENLLLKSFTNKVYYIKHRIVAFIF